MTNNPTDLQAALRKACEEAAKDIIRDAQCSVNLTCPSENSLISRMLQYVPPLFEALVAAAYAACAKTCLGNVLSEEQMNGEPNLHVGEMCLRLCHERDAAAIRKLTPADAARELERRELEGVRWIWEQDFADAYNGGYLTERGRELVLKRIASLSKRLAVNLERIKAQARLEEAKWWLGPTEPHEFPNHSSRKCVLCQRIAALEARAKEKP